MSYHTMLALRWQIKAAKNNCVKESVDVAFFLAADGALYTAFFCGTYELHKS
jgi:hypothetical protein